MSDQDGSQLESYQFSEYMDTASVVGQMPSQSAQIPPTSSHPQSQPTSIPYPPSGYGYPMAYYPAPPAYSVPKQKKKLYFPLTRHASPGKQVVSIVIYSALMIALFAGSIFFLNLRPEDPAARDAFVHSDGTADVLQILIFTLFSLLILPATNLLGGAFFGAWRGFLVTSLVTGVTASLLIVYAYVNHIPITLSDADTPAFAVFVLSPTTAALVGWFYDRRTYAAWWKSFLILLLGSTFFVIALLTLVAILGRPAGTSSQATLTSFYIGIGCIGILLIPLMTLPIAGTEGVMHAVLAARRNKNK